MNAARAWIAGAVTHKGDFSQIKVHYHEHAGLVKAIEIVEEESIVLVRWIMISTLIEISE